MSTADMDQEKLGELLSAYVDGELDAQDVELVERVVRDDEDARRLLDELRRTASLVSSLPRHAAPNSIADDVRLQLERSELLGDVQPPRAASGGRRSPLVALLSMAAAVGFIVIGGVWIVQDRDMRGTGLRDDIVAVGPAEEKEVLGELEEAGAKSTAVSKDAAAPSTRKAGKKGRTRDREVSSRAKLRAATSRSKPALPHSARRESAIAGRESAQRRSAGPGGTGASTNPMANAPVEQKLAAGVDPGDLRGHRFSDETVRLRVTVSDVAQRDALATTIAEYLAKQRMADLSTGAQGANRAARVDEVGSFYYRGTPGVNFDSADEQQILVRAPARELDGLLTEVADATDEKEDVSLVSGPGEVVARGLDETRKALSLSAEVPERVAAADRSRLDSDRQSVRTRSRDTQWDDKSKEGPAADRRTLVDVIRGLGLDPDRLGTIKGPADDGVAGEPARPSQPSFGGTQASDSATDIPPGAIVADAEGKGEGKPALPVQAESADLRDEPAEMKKSGSDGRSSLVERRSQALEEEARKRARGRRAEPPTGTRESSDDTSATTRTGPPSTFVAAGESNQSDRFVTLVVELVVSGPQPSRDDARSAKTGQTGSTKTTKKTPPPSDPAQR